MKTPVLVLGLILLSAAAVMGAENEKEKTSADAIVSGGSQLRDFLKSKYVYVNPTVWQKGAELIGKSPIQTDLADDEGHGFGGGGFGFGYILPVYSVGYPLYGGYGYGCNSGLYGGYGYGGLYGGGYGYGC